MFRREVFGAEDTGASVYDLPPGQALCPYHYEYGEEEWALVLEGTARLRTPEGTEAIGPMELAFFPKGPEGAHMVRNDTDAAGADPDVLEHRVPHRDRLSRQRQGRRLDGHRGRGRDGERSSNVGYFHGET